MTITISYPRSTKHYDTRIFFDVEVTDDVLFEYFRNDIVSKGRTPSDDFAEGARKALATALEYGYFEQIAEDSDFIGFLHDYYEGKVDDSNGYYE